MALKIERLTAEQINTPQAVFRMAEYCQPGRSIRTGVRTAVLQQYSPYHVFIDLKVEHKTQLLRDCKAEQPARTDDERTKSGYDTIYRTEVRRPFTASIQN